MIWYFIIGCVSIITVIGMILPRCRHIWAIIKEHNIQVRSTRDGDYLSQTEVLMSCKNCGELIRMNLTTGVKEVISSGGTPSNDTINIK